MIAISRRRNALGIAYRRVVSFAPAPETLDLRTQRNTTAAAGYGRNRPMLVAPADSLKAVVRRWAPPSNLGLVGRICGRFSPYKAGFGVALRNLYSLRHVASKEFCSASVRRGQMSGPPSSSMISAMALSAGIFLSLASS